MNDTHPHDTSPAALAADTPATSPNRAQEGRGRDRTAPEGTGKGAPQRGAEKRADVILRGEVDGHDLDDCLKRAEGQAGQFFGPRHAIYVRITSATPTAWNYAGEVENFTAEYTARQVIP